jgi:hypothetical protein
MPALVTTIKSNVIKSASPISLSYQIADQKKHKLRAIGLKRHF